MSTTATTAQAAQVYVFIKAAPEQVRDAITKPEFTEQYVYGVRIEVADGRRVSSTGDPSRAEDVLESDPAAAHVLSGLKSLLETGQPL
jgi:hypothetical protein